MRHDDQGTCGSYLHTVLADGSRPFRYRAGVRSLLGIPESGEGERVRFSSLPPPVGFRYAGCEVRSAVGEVRSEECGVRSADYGLQTPQPALFPYEGCEVRSAECGVRSKGCEVRSAGCEMRSAGYRLQTPQPPLFPSDESRREVMLRLGAPIERNIERNKVDAAGIDKRRQSKAGEPPDVEGDGRWTGTDGFMKSSQVKAVEIDLGSRLCMQTHAHCALENDSEPCRDPINRAALHTRPSNPLIRDMARPYGERPEPRQGQNTGEFAAMPKRSDAGSTRSTRSIRATGEGNGAGIEGVVKSDGEIKHGQPRRSLIMNKAQTIAEEKSELRQEKRMSEPAEMEIKLGEIVKTSQVRVVETEIGSRPHSGAGILLAYRQGESQADRPVDNSSGQDLEIGLEPDNRPLITDAVRLHMKIGQTRAGEGSKAGTGNAVKSTQAKAIETASGQIGSSLIRSVIQPHDRGRIKPRQEQPFSPGSDPFRMPNLDTARKIERLQQEVRQLTSQGSSQSAGRDRNTERPKAPRPLSPPAQKVIIVKRFPNPSRTPCAFWERSYLSRFHLRVMR